MKRSYTVAFDIGCDDKQTSATSAKQCQYGQLAFPDWEDYKGRSFPVFSVTEEMTIN